MENKPNLTLVEVTPEFKEPDLANVMAAQKQFNTAYEIPKNKATQELYIKLIEEEHEEWVEEYYGADAKRFDELKELTDLLYVTAGLYFVLGYTYGTAAKYRLQQEETWDFVISKYVEKVSTGEIDKRTLSQLMYCLYAYADSCEWNLEEAYRRVHLSNLSKLGEDGKPIRREDGKILKGQYYKPPYLEDLTNGE